MNDEMFSGIILEEVAQLFFQFLEKTIQYYCDYISMIYINRKVAIF